MARDKCLVCDNRPRHGESPYCYVCGQTIEQQTKASKPEKPLVYIVYRGAVVGMFPVNGSGIYRPRLLKMSETRVPKRNSINLDRFCPGYTRDQVKKMKRAVRSVTAAIK